MIRGALRPLIRGGLRGVIPGVVWTPAALFADGQQGVWYEPKPEYLYQDSAGTTPVTADGQPVGYMQDLSGNGNHATQSTAAAKPLYRTDGTLHWLEGDGVDDYLYHGLALLGSITSIAAAESLLATSGGQGLILFSAENSPLHAGLWSEVINSDNWGTYASSFEATTTSLLNNKKIVAVERDDSDGIQRLYTNNNLELELSGYYAGDTLDRRSLLRENNGSSERYGNTNFFGSVAANYLMTADERGKATNHLANLAGVTL